MSHVTPSYQAIGIATPPMVTGAGAAALLGRPGALKTCGAPFQAPKACHLLKMVTQLPKGLRARVLHALRSGAVSTTSQNLSQARTSCELELGMIHDPLQLWFIHLYTRNI